MSKSNVFLNKASKNSNAMTTGSCQIEQDMATLLMKCYDYEKKIILLTNENHQLRLRVSHDKLDKEENQINSSQQEGIYRIIQQLNMEIEENNSLKMEIISKEEIIEKLELDLKLMSESNYKSRQIDPKAQELEAKLKLVEDTNRKLTFYLNDFAFKRVKELESFIGDLNELKKQELDINDYEIEVKEELNFFKNNLNSKVSYGKDTTNESLDLLIKLNLYEQTLNKFAVTFENELIDLQKIKFIRPLDILGACESDNVNNKDQTEDSPNRCIRHNHKKRRINQEDEEEFFHNK